MIKKYNKIIMPDYSKTIIYKICCNDENITECYIGHTTEFNNRKYKHKNSKPLKAGLRKISGWCIQGIHGP